MGGDIGVVIISSVLPLLGVLVGTGATVFGQRSSVREARVRAEAERRQSRRDEVKAAISAYLEIAQHLQTQLYAKEHGREVLDIPVMVEQIWLAHAQVDILCSENMREPLVRHAAVLNEVARHEENYPDWWKVVLPYKAALLDAVREELKWPEGMNDHLVSHLGKSKSILGPYMSFLSQFEEISEQSKLPKSLA